MREKVNKPRGHLISKPGENDVGASRFCLLRAAANRAAEAFKEGFCLEAIALTESLLATRLESRVAWVRACQRGKLPVRFSTLGALCNELLSKSAPTVPDAEEFGVPIQNIREWANKRNTALHEMAKLNEGDGGGFKEKYKMSRDFALNGFEALLAYDALDREVRRSVGEYAATDDKNNETAFKCLRDLVRRTEPRRRASLSGSARPTSGLHRTRR
jgi:hypothetical protein